MTSKRMYGTIAERFAYLLKDEFADVRSAAHRLGATGARSDLVIEREDLRLSSGAAVSAIRWGEKPPRYLLLHGGGLNAHAWDQVAFGLGQPLAAPDLPGHGHSSWRQGADYQPSVLADTLLEWMSESCPEPIHVVGQSLGGLTALELADRAGARVHSVTMVDITPGRTGQSRASRSIQEFIGAAKEFHSYEELAAHAERTGVASGGPSLERGLIHNSRVTSDGRVVFRHHFASPPAGGFAEYDIRPLWDVLERLAQPVQLVIGSRGIVDEDQIKEFVRRRPDAPVTTLEAGHNVHRDAPDELVQTIVTFSRPERSADRQRP